MKTLVHHVPANFECFSEIEKKEFSDIESIVKYFTEIVKSTNSHLTISTSFKSEKVDSLEDGIIFLTSLINDGQTIQIAEHNTSSEAFEYVNMIVRPTKFKLQ